jgi:hypothetical protein
VSIPECIRAPIHRDSLTLVNSDRVSQQLNTPQLESRSTFALTMALKAARQGCSESRVATSDRDARAFACTCDIVAEAGVGLDKDGYADVLISPLSALSSTSHLGAVGLVLATCCRGAVESVSNVLIAPARVRQGLLDGVHHQTILVAYIHTCAAVQELYV